MNTAVAPLTTQPDIQHQQELAPQEQFPTQLTSLLNKAASILDFHEMLQSVADNLRQLFEADGCYITAWELEKGAVAPLAASGPFQEGFAAQPLLPDKDTITTAVLNAAQVLVLPDAQNSSFKNARIVSSLKPASLLGIPLIAGGQKWGVAILTSHMLREFTLDEIRRAEIAATPIALVIAKTQLLHEEREQRALAEALRDAGAAVNETLDFEEVLDRILEQIARVVPYDSANIMLVENGRIRVVRHRGYEYTDPSQGSPIARFSCDVNTTVTFREIVQTKRPYIVSDTTLFSGWVGTTGHIRSWAGVPIIIGYQVAAVIGVDKMEPDFYQPEHTTRLAAFANQMALALRNAQMHKATQRQLEELAVLQALAAATVTAQDEDDLLERATQIIGDTLYPHNFGVVLLDSTAVNLRPHHSYRIRNRHVQIEAFPLTQGIVGHVAQTGQPYRTPNVQQDPYYVYIEEETRSELCVPLREGNHLIGVINAESDELDAFSDGDEHLLLTFANQLGVALEKLKLLAETQHQAEELRLISHILRQLNASPDVTAVFPTLGHDIKKLTNCTAVILFLLNEQQTISQLITTDISTLHPQMPISLAGTAVFASIQAGKIHKHPTLQIAPDNPLTQHLHNTGHHSCLTIPMHTGTQSFGGLTLAWPQTNGYDKIPLARFQQVAHAIALALQRSHLFEEVKSWAYKLTILQHLNQEITGLVTDREICNTFVQHLCHHLRYQSASIHLADHQAQQLVCEALVGPNQELIEPGRYRQDFGDGLIGLAAQTGKLQIVNNTEKNPHFRPSPRTTVRSELVIPLKHEGQIMGVLNVDSASYDAFSHNDVAILTVAADQLVAALERGRLFEQIRLRAAKLEALSSLSTELRLAQNIDEMLPVILQRAMSVVGGSLGSLYLKDSEEGTMVACGVYPPNPHLLGRRFRTREGIIGEIAATGNIHLTEDMASSREARFYDEEKQMVNSLQIRSGIGVPLRTQTRIVGVMYISLPEVHKFTADEIDFLTAISEIAGGALDRMLLLQSLEERVTERTRELADANERLQELDRLKSRFISEVSHELRTPITNLTLYLDLFGQSKPEKQAHYLSVLRKQTDRLAQLVEDILSLSRLELSNERVKLAPLDLNKVVETAVSTLKPRVAEAGLTLTLRLEPDLPFMNGEANQLSLLVSHLLSNAIQYTPSGSIDIRTEVNEAGDWLFLRVMDTGRGISTDDREHLFDRFYRGHFATQSSIPGTGLGLSIVKEVVDLHGGQIVVESDEGKGTTFTIWLPVAGESVIGER